MTQIEVQNNFSIGVCIYRTRFIIDTKPLVTIFNCDLPVSWAPAYRNMVWTGPHPLS